jgi:hypothetical protein
LQKLYAYVDENGQDTIGAVFFVSVVMVDQEREQLASLLERIETHSGKNKRKWSKSRPDRRLAYIQELLSERAFIGRLHYSVSYNTTNYVQLTIQTTARAITRYSPTDYKVTVIVDGLSKPEERRFAAGLRRHFVRTEKIRGATEEADIFIRLADAVCGFLREAEEPEADVFRALKQKAVREGYIIQV